MKSPPLWLCSFLTLTLSGILSTANAAPAERPNVLLIFTDDQGTNDVGCYGSEIPTPHTDSLASAGLKFEAWYTASSICTPSRFGLLTGRNPSRSRDRLLGALMFLEPGDATRGIRAGETTFPDLLRGSGYRTALIGKWHLGHGAKHFLPTRHGFDSFYGHTGGCIDYFTMKYGNKPDWYRDEERIDVKGFATEVITDEAVRFLATRKNADRPFYLHLAYNAPHFGKGWDEKKQTVVNILQPRPQELRRVEHIEDAKRREFASMVVALDDGIGRVLQALEENGLTKDTLVIFMTDHGGDPVYGGSNLPYRGSKATLFEGGIRVPCIMRWPGKIPAGRTTPAVGSAMDLFPTLSRLAGVDTSKLELDGRDLTPLLLEPVPIEEVEDRQLYWELGAHQELKRTPWTALRWGRWKLLEHPPGEVSLFDLVTDPYEKTDLAKTRPEKLRQMVERRDELREQYRQ